MGVMSSLMALTLAALALLVAQGAQAMNLVRVGDDLFAAGPVVDTDFLAFKTALAEAPVKRLILVNSPGGDLWTGMQIARMVVERPVTTLASGFCYSACSFIFMAGQQRQFATGNKPANTLVGIHGPHNGDTGQLAPNLAPQVYALYKTRMGNNFNAEVINQALYKIEDPGGMLTLRELERGAVGDVNARFCPSARTPWAKCQVHAGVDAHSLGVVTSRETVTVELPPPMQPKLYFFGRPLPDVPKDFSDRADELITTICPDFICRSFARDRFDKWAAEPTHRALSVGLGKLGYGDAWGEADPGLAILRSLYRCNHVPNNKKLCRLVAVDQQETHAFYDEVVTQSRGMLAALPVPKPDAVSEERGEPAAGVPERFRTDNYDTMTPVGLRGVRRVDTAELAGLLASSKTPRVIDVIVTVPAMLPSALHFVSGGLAFADSGVEAGYDQRFRDMLAVAVEDKNTPVVFYCIGSQSWHSANAAMRAVKAGYTQVMWYRGGLQAWQAAGMPVTGKVAHAVIH